MRLRKYIKNVTEQFPKMNDTEENAHTIYCEKFIPMANHHEKSLSTPKRKHTLTIGDTYYNTVDCFCVLNTQINPVYLATLVVMFLYVLFYFVFYYVTFDN